MTVKELITELSKFNPNYRVFITDHGAEDMPLEILGCYESVYYNTSDEDEPIVELYEY